MTEPKVDIKINIQLPTDLILENLLLRQLLVDQVKINKELTESARPVFNFNQN